MKARLVSKTWHADFAPDIPAKYRKACKYTTYSPAALADLELTIDGRLAGLVADAESAIRDLNDRARPALVPLARLLLKTESIASSKVEGLQIGVRDLARVEARLDAGEGKVSSTAIEILANIEAMELAIQEASEPTEFTIEAIQKIHERLMLKSPHPHLGGRIRSVQNWIGGNDYNPCGADFVPPPPEEVQPLLADLCVAINDDVLPPLVQAALIHAQFETIHPFEDGNGRTGRALIHVVLKRRGIATNYVPPISATFSNSRDRYISGLVDYRTDEINRWIEHFAGAAWSAGRLAQEYIESVARMTEAWRAKLSASRGALRSDAAAWAVIDILPMYPMLSSAIAAAATGRSKPQVYQAIEQLVVANVIKPAGNAGRSQVYEAVGLVDLLTALERGDPAN